MSASKEGLESADWFLLFCSFDQKEDEEGREYVTIPSILQVMQQSQAGSPLNNVKEILTAAVDNIAITVPMHVRITTFRNGTSRP